MKKLAIGLLFVSSPLAAGPVATAIIQVEKAQVQEAKIPQGQRALQKASKSIDELKVKLVAPKQQLAAMKAQLEEARKTLTDVQKRKRNRISSAAALTRKQRILQAANH